MREATGGVEVSFLVGVGVRRTAQVVMTPGEWEELSEVIQRESPDSVRQRLLALDDDSQFLVCDSGVELVASSSRNPPPGEWTDCGLGPGGAWVVTDEAGEVVSRFADLADDG